MNEELRKKIGLNIQKGRKERNLTQAEIAEKVDSDTNYYAKIERGEVVPSLTLLIKIADTLEIEYADLFSKRSSK